MGNPAARLGDPHMCPMVNPGPAAIPHVGMPISGPGIPTVLVGSMPASVVGDMCPCVGPPDSVAMGSTGVMFGGMPAARMGDPTAHGGQIVMGCPTVLVGESGGGGGGGGGSAQAAEEMEQGQFVKIALVDEEGNPAALEKYSIELPDGSIREGRLGPDGMTIVYVAEEGDCTVTFPECNQEDWSQ